MMAKKTVSPYLRSRYTLLREVLERFPQVHLAVLFGSMASGHQRQDSIVKYHLTDLTAFAKMVAIKLEK